MRLLDRYLGAILLSFLRGFEFFRWLMFHRVYAKKKPQVFLVQKYFGIGSILNAFPLIDLLKQEIPHIRIVFLTFESNRCLFEISKKVDDVIYIRSQRLGWFIWDCLRAIFKFQRMGIDACIDLEFFSRFSMVMSYMSRAWMRAGFFSYFNMRSDLLTHPVAFNHYKHISRAFLAMAETLGLNLHRAKKTFSLPSRIHQEEQKLKEMLGSFANERIVAINPNASSLCSQRRWTGKRYAQLAQRLAEELENCVFVFIGNSSERGYVQKICDHLSDNNRIFNWAGKLNFSQLMAFLEMSELLISNDSGPVHIAAAYKTKTVALYGPETPVLYHPLNPHARILFKDLYCSPCINVLDNKNHDSCVATHCMNGISVDDVFHECKMLMLDESQLTS